MQIATDKCLKKNKDSGRIRQPTENLRQAVHEQEETIHHHDAKAQKEHDRCHHCHLMEEGSENEDEENSDDGRDIEEDDCEEEHGGIQVGHRNTLEAPL